MSSLPPHPGVSAPAFPRRASRWLGLAIVAAVALLASTLTSVPAQAAQPSSGLISDSAKPNVKAVASKKSAAIGVKFRPSKDGKITAVQFYRGPRQKNKEFVASVWSASGKRLAKVKLKKSSRVGWQTAKLASPVSVKAGKTYTVSYLAKGGRYPVAYGTFKKTYRRANLTVPKNGAVRTYTKKSVRPTKSVAKGAHFLVDVVFKPNTKVLAPAPKPTPAPTTPAPKPSPTTPAPAPTTPAPTTPAPTPPAPSAPAVAERPVGSDGVPRGFPNAATTGVRAGVSLKDSGSITVTEPGTVIEGLRVSGTITISADNVVVRDTLVRGGGDGYPIRVTRGVKNALIEHVELDNENSTGIGIFFNGGSGRVRHANIHSAEDGIRIQADDVIVENSYIHDLHRVSGGHHDSIQIRSGNNVTIRGNSLVAYVSRTGDPMNAAIQVGSLTGSALQNFNVVDNFMNGGNYTINGGKLSYIASGSFTGNVFGTDYRYGIRTSLGGVPWSNNALVNGESVR